MTVLWRVSIRLAKKPGKQLAVVHEYVVLDADRERAKAIALAEWGFPYRLDDKVISVVAKDAGVVVKSGLYTSKLVVERPQSVPSVEAVAEAGAYLRSLEILDEVQA